MVKIPYPLLLVEWEDAYNGDHDWADPEKLNDLRLIVFTVGFEVKRTKDQLVLAMSHHPDCGVGARICDLFTIPLGMIRRERILRRP